MKLKSLSLVIIAIFLASCASPKNRIPTANEKRAEVYYAQGTSELIAKNYTQALTHLIQSRDLNPKSSMTRNNLGMAYFFREQYALAEKEILEAIKIDPKNTDAILNLGSLYMHNGQLKEAKAQFLKAEQDLIFPNQFRTYYNLALLSLKEGDRKSAHTYLGKSIKENSDYCSAHYKLGELYAEEYRFSQALTSFKEASNGTCVNEPAPHYQQAIALVNLNKLHEAKRKLNEIKEKFASTRYASLSVIQLNKIENTLEQQANRRSLQTERIKVESDLIETPNF